MPSSTDRKRLEVSTYLYDRLIEIAINEDRTVASVTQQIIAAGLASYQPGMTAPVDLSRYSPRALAALERAREETVPFNHNFVGTEHLLLGLLGVEGGVAARVLDNLGVDYDRCRMFMQTHLSRGEGTVPSPANLPLVPRTRKVLRLAVEEADRLDTHAVGTEHLLLGLTRVRDSIAARILGSLGVLDAIRDETGREMAKRTYLWEENEYGIADPIAHPAGEEAGVQLRPANNPDSA